MDIVNIDTEYIRLDQLLKWAGIAVSGSDAKYLIQNDMVSVNNIIVRERGKKVFPGDHVSIEMDDKITFIVEKN